MADVSIQCLDCGWHGKGSDCIHTFRDKAYLESSYEAYDEPALELCPECRSDNLVEISSVSLLLFRDTQGEY